MIILIIALLTLATFFSFMFIKKASVRWVLGPISLVLLVVSVLGLTLHISEHWGMKEVSKTTTQEIFTAGDLSAPYGMMVKAEIGQNTGNYVLVYRENETSAKPETHFEPDQKHISEAVKKTATYKLVSGDKASVTTKTTRREFSSNLMKRLFGFGGEAHQLVKQHAVVSVPRDTWLVLTQEQVEKLTKEAPAMQKQMEAKLKAHPEQAVQLAELQKSNPKEYAKMQVEQIKQLLGIKE